MSKPRIDKFKSTSIRCVTFSFDNGNMTVYFPNQLSVEDIEQAEDYMTIFFRQLKRRSYCNFNVINKENNHDQAYD